MDDFQIRLTRRWPITCPQTGGLGLFSAGTYVEFSVDGSGVRMSINGVLQNTPISELHAGYQLTTIPSNLESDQVASFSTPDGDIGQPESFLGNTMNSFEHQTFLLVTAQGQYVVYAFVVMPSPTHSKHDILLLGVLPIQNGHPVGDNSVHGGPPT